MKVVWRIILIVALALLILGAALIGVSLFSGGSIEGVRNNVPLMNFEQSFPDEAPTALLLDIPAGRLTVETGDTLRVEARNVTESGFACLVENGTLIVRETREVSWSNMLSRLISLRKSEPEYHVWLPADLALTRAELHIAAGTADVQALRADAVRLQMAAGTVALTSLRAQSVAVELAAGNLSLFDLDTQILSLQMAAGHAGISGSIHERCVADLAAGEAVFKLTGSSADYSARLEAAAGEILYDGRSCTLGRASVGSGEGTMSLRSGAGRISVAFFG